MPNKCLKVKGVNRFDVFLMYTGFAYMILDQNLFTVILSEKKCYSISNIAFLEIVLQIATIILEIPTGIIGDFVSRKILLISARILYILYAIIFLNSKDLSKIDC